jgi:hypothetical protein
VQLTKLGRKNGDIRNAEHSRKDSSAPESRRKGEHCLKCAQLIDILRLGEKRTTECVQSANAPKRVRLTTDESALYLRSVRGIITAFRGLRCHPLTCIVLKIRLSVDSIPSALTIISRSFNILQACKITAESSALIGCIWFLVCFRVEAVDPVHVCARD